MVATFSPTSSPHDESPHTSSYAWLPSLAQRLQEFWPVRLPAFRHHPDSIRVFVRKIVKFGTIVCQIIQFPVGALIAC